MSNEKYLIYETKKFSKSKIRLFNKKEINILENKIYNILKKNPYKHKNIKKLKGKYFGLYRYRYKDFRIIYTIESDKLIVILVSLLKRKNSYK